MRSAELGIKRLFQLISALIVVMFLSAIVYAKLEDRWAIGNGTSGQWSWRIPGPGSSDVLANQVYANDLIPGVNGSYSLGTSANYLKNVYATNVISNGGIKNFSTFNTNGTMAATQNLAISNLTNNITINMTVPTAGAAFDVFSATGNVGVQGNVTLNCTSGTTINGASSFTFTNVTNNLWPRASVHAYNTTAWQVSY